MEAAGAPNATPVKPRPVKIPRPVTLKGWPLVDQKPGKTKDVDLGGGKKMEFVRVPAGKFVMGDLKASPDEVPQTIVEIKKSFWMSSKEITNEEYARFDPAHNSRWIDLRGKNLKSPGHPVNKPEQPVCRVSWAESMKFCDWLAKKSGEKIALPTEAQWEWACRAGTDAPFWYGARGTDYAKRANLADNSVLNNPDDAFLYYIIKDPTVNDRAFITVAPGSYAPNPWGTIRHARKRRRVDALVVQTLSVRGERWAQRRRANRPQGMPWRFLEGSALPFNLRVSDSLRKPPKGGERRFPSDYRRLSF